MALILSSTYSDGLTQTQHCVSLRYLLQHALLIMSIAAHAVQKEFGGWKGRDHEMKRAAEETLKNNMKLDKLKKLYEKASHNSGGAAHKGQDSMIAKILDAYMPSDLVAKLDKPCLEASLVWRVQQSDSDVNTERIKRIKGEKHHSTKKQLQWELLSAWHQNVSYL